MSIREVRQYKPEERMQKITTCVADIQRRMSILPIPNDSYQSLLICAYRSVRQWEQETPDAQEIFALAREQADATSSQTLPILSEALVQKFSPEQTRSLISVGYGSAKKEEQLAARLHVGYDRDIAVVGIERDYGLMQTTPPFLSKPPNRSILLSPDDESPYAQVANVDGSNSVGLMILSAHHTLVSLSELFKKFKGLNGLVLVEELIKDDQWANPEYRMWRAAIEILFNYAFANEMPNDFDFETQFDAKYYTREEVLAAGGTIIDIPNTQIPPISIVFFTKESLEREH